MAARPGRSRPADHRSPVPTTADQSPAAEVRAEFLIDPRSTACWVRFECSGSERSLFVYSFGPNRLRDSGAWELRGDDVGD